MVTTASEVQTPAVYEEAVVSDLDLKAMEELKSEVGVGLVQKVIARYIPEDRTNTWNNPPAPGARIREYYFEIKPLDCTYFSSTGNPYRIFTVQIDDLTGKPKGANSAVGRMKESGKRIGFQDPKGLEGHIVQWRRGQEKFGGMMGTVLRFEKVLKEYVHDGELPIKDYRKEGGQEYAVTEAAAETPTVETFQMLATALDGLRPDDFVEISKAVRGNPAFTSPMISELKSQEMVIEYLVENGFGTLSDTGSFQAAS